MWACQTFQATSWCVVPSERVRLQISPGLKSGLKSWANIKPFQGVPGVSGVAAARRSSYSVLMIPPVLVSGEALFDFFSTEVGAGLGGSTGFHKRAGGSPFNIAI